MKVLFDAIGEIGFCQYLKINVRQSFTNFSVHQIKIWNHGEKFRGIMRHHKGLEVLHRKPLTAQEVVSIIEYLGVTIENSRLKMVNEPFYFMKDLNREWYFTANPRQAEVKAIHSNHYLSDQSHSVCNGNALEPILVDTQRVCSVCKTPFEVRAF